MLNEVYVSRKLKEVEEFEEGIGERLKKLDKVVEERIGKFKGMDFIPKGLVADLGTGMRVRSQRLFVLALAEEPRW